MYYNGPLPPGHWHPAIGIVSSMEGFVETSYSISSHDQHAGVVEESSKDPGMRNPRQKTNLPVECS